MTLDACTPPLTPLKRPWLAILGSRWVARLIALTLFALPIAVYWNTTFHYFGFRDDYPMLVEARDEPGKIVRVTGSQGRPLYGLLVQASLEQARSIQNLQWLRLAGTTGLGLIAALLFGVLRRQGWSWAAAAFAAAMIPLTPAAQVLAGWAITWPLPIAALLSLSAFALAEQSRERWRGFAWAGAVLLIATSALIYQPYSLFYLIGVAASLPRRRGQALQANLRWTGVHLAIVLAGLATAFFVMQLWYATGVFAKSHRVVFEDDPLGKLGWFVQEPLPNALNILVLNDWNDHPAGQRAYTAGLIITLLLLIAGLSAEWRRHGRLSSGFWLILLIALLPAAFSMNLIVAEKFPSYRTILVLTSVLVVFLTLSWRNLCQMAAERKGRLAEWTGYAVVLAVAISTAQQHTYSLITLIRTQELNVLEQAAHRVALRPDSPLSIYFVQPADDHPSGIIYYSEFGSFDVATDWMVEAMFKQIMYERFPDRPDREQRYRIQMGAALPPRIENSDFIFDLRPLGVFGPFYKDGE